MPTPTTEIMSWTKPYYGLSHCGSIHDFRRASVQDYGEFAELQKWFKGCGFSPHVEQFDTVSAAMRAGEKWIKHGL